MAIACGGARAAEGADDGMGTPACDGGEAFDGPSAAAGLVNVLVEGGLRQPHQSHSKAE